METEDRRLSKNDAMTFGKGFVEDRKLGKQYLPMVSKYSHTWGLTLQVVPIDVVHSYCEKWGLKTEG